jgi:TRAP transporter TAXI family solute receptor
MFRSALIAFSLALCLPLLAQAAEAGMGMVTGAKAGTYYLMGQDIAEIARKEGVTLTVRESSGSVDNLQKMATTGENAALGIVQSDVISFLLRSTMPKSKDIVHKLRVVAPLFQEEIHLLARKEISSFDQLAGKRVVVGSAGSGSMMTAVNLLSQLGVKPKRLFEVSSAEAIVAVLANRADAMVFVGGKPVPMFENLTKLSGAKDANMANLLNDVHFLSIPADRAQGVYEPATITSKDYSFVNQDTPTLAVRAMLVSYDFTLKNTPYYHARCKDLQELGRALARALPELKNGSGHQKWAEVDLNQEVKLWKRDACAWPGIQSLTSNVAASAPKPLGTIGEAKPIIPQHSAFESELLGIIRGK